MAIYGYSESCGSADRPPPKLARRTICRDDWYSYFFLQVDVMSQRAQAFAALGRSILLAVLLGTLQANQASAITIQLTSGVISEENCCTVPFEITESHIHVAGAGFLLETDPQYDRFFIPLEGPPGAAVSLSFGTSIVSVSTPGTRGSLIYGGQQYYGSGFIAVGTPSFVIGPTATVAFNLSGSFLARTLVGDFVEFDLVGAGMAQASFTFVDQPGTPPFWLLHDVRYNVAPPPVPEPTSLMLLGSGLLGWAAHRRSARPNG